MLKVNISGVIAIFDSSNSLFSNYSSYNPILIYQKYINAFAFNKLYDSTLKSTIIALNAISGDNVLITGNFIVPYIGLNTITISSIIGGQDGYNYLLNSYTISAYINQTPLTPIFTINKYYDRTTKVPIYYTLTGLYANDLNYVKLNNSIYGSYDNYNANLNELHFHS